MGIYKSFFGSVLQIFLKLDFFEPVDTVSGHSTGSAPGRTKAIYLFN